MNKIVFIIQKKPIKDRPRSLDRALGHLKNNIHLDFHRWVSDKGSTTRICRSSYQDIVIPNLEDINSAISRYLPDFTAFKIENDYSNIDCLIFTQHLTEVKHEAVWSDFGQLIV